MPLGFYGNSKLWDIASKSLPAPSRRHVHALYGFCRYADEIVDNPGAGGPSAVAWRLGDLRDRLFTGLERGGSDDVMLAAVRDAQVTPPQRGSSCEDT